MINSRQIVEIINDEIDKSNGDSIRDSSVGKVALTIVATSQTLSPNSRCLNSLHARMRTGAL